MHATIECTSFIESQSCAEKTYIEQFHTLSSQFPEVKFDLSQLLPLLLSFSSVEVVSFKLAALRKPFEARDDLTLTMKIAGEPEFQRVGFMEIEQLV